ncbi:MAG: Glu/Leu/Phe/Val dehydrogenase dimerization domain-containing protein, partial [Planctomycetota bacterium]
MKIETIAREGYEHIARCEDPESGLRALISIHDTTLGPALGGMRMWPYASWDDALFDVLRLSKGMTYKSAVADTGLGGGKSVILGNPKTDKSAKLFEAMGSFVDSMGGRYITAEDVGTSVEDMVILKRKTKWVTGLPHEMGTSGDPSPWTALGVFRGMKACLEEV